MKGKLFFVIAALVLLGSLISVAPAQATPAETSPAAQALPGCWPYTVKSGDYLGLIAEKCRSTVSLIKSQNGLGSSNTIQPGQKLYCPRYSAPTPNPCYHVVKRGETAIGIANAHGIKLTTLIAWNPVIAWRGGGVKTGETLRVC